MARRTVQATIVNRLGLHARPAMSFVDTAAGFACAVAVRKGELEVDGKSIMQMMMLAATRGTVLEIIADGDDADNACEALARLIADGFGEE